MLMPIVAAKLRGILASCSVQISIPVFEPAMGAAGGKAYLEFSKGKSTASAHTTIVFYGGAADDGSQLVDWTRSDGSGFMDTSITATGFASGL